MISAPKRTEERLKEKGKKIEKTARHVFLLYLERCIE